eukprot:TRINITY_DN89451_c0_g2_i1.p1 TRINITY_DN89451_c0_g2~~TRINITY_DN89451_c0_g2_i1.p1  ORF type:complete len:267 (+),score=16.81 TRINITY_DN89451_c0_g2_i1:246-1046(+)
MSSSQRQPSVKASAAATSLPPSNVQPAALPIAGRHPGRRVAAATNRHYQNRSPPVGIAVRESSESEDFATIQDKKNDVLKAQRTSRASSSSPACPHQSRGLLIDFNDLMAQCEKANQLAETEELSAITARSSTTRHQRNNKKAIPHGNSSSTSTASSHLPSSNIRTKATGKLHQRTVSSPLDSRQSHHANSNSDYGTTATAQCPKPFAMSQYKSSPRPEDVPLPSFLMRAGGSTAISSIGNSGVARRPNNHIQPSPASYSHSCTIP